MNKKNLIIAAVFIALTFVGGRAQETEVMSVSRNVVTALRNKNMTALAKYVHPTKGVRFSPYGFINTDKEDLVFKKSQIAGLQNSRKIYDWGAYDAGENEIKMNFSGYYKKFIYNKDFARAPQIAYNKIIKQGNTLINISDAYPKAKFVEYHFGGTKKYGGMDWNSLRLIFEESGGKWYLVGISHDQWTI